MRADYSVELTYAFVVGEDELKKLSRLLSDRIGKVEYRADCADDVARNFTSVAEIMKFENPKLKQIRRLHISACSDDFSKRATIDMSGSQWRGISLDFHARDDVVDRLRMEVLDIVAGMRPWWSVFHRVDFVSLSFVAYLVLWFGLLALAALIPADKSNINDPNSSALAQLVVYGGIALLFAVGLLLNRFRDRVFPRAVFLIGQGKTRFHQLERFQWGFIIAFITSFLAGIVIVVWQSVSA